MKNISSNVRSNDTSSRYSRTEAEGIAVCTVFIVADVFIVSGNLLTLVLFASSKKLRKRSLFMVINMAFSDLLLGILTLPVFIGMKGDSYQLWRFKSSQYLRKSYIFADTAFSQASLISAVFISLERFHAVSWPLQHRTLSPRAYHVGISVVWVLSILVSTICNVLVWFKTAKDSLYFWIPYALIVLLLLCSCNIGIWRKSQHRAVVSQQNIVNSQRLTKTLLFVSMLFLNFVYEIWTSWLSLAYSVADILNYCNSCINPIVYAFTIPEFKRAIRFRCTGKTEVLTVRQDKISGQNKIGVFLTFENQGMDTQL
ncbi:histamine H2 receptor-like [Montipora foliosa]|uniref:histamine H2 receptor-like n=1 Tax=Montipora foliosa TaxID=591990 RepID=UPI0035F1F623